MSDCSKIIRTTALVLIAAFSLNEISWAAPALTVSTPISKTMPKIGISPVHGRVRELYKGKQPQLLIHIQDAHANLGAQKNISAILDQLAREHGVEHVFVEGGTRDDSLDFLRPLAPPHVREDIKHQLGIAIHAYHQAHRALPNRRLTTYEGTEVAGSFTLTGTPLTSPEFIITVWAPALTAASKGGRKYSRR